MNMNKLKQVGNKITSVVTGGRNKSKDSNFSEVNKLFEEQQSNLKKVANDIVGFVSGIDAILASQKSLSENILKVVPPGSASADMCAAQIQCVERMIESKKGLLEASLNAGFMIPLNTYQGQYREMADRIKERNRRESEMYKMMDQRDKYKEKNDARLNGAEQRVLSTTQAYEELNNELLDDIPKLVADSENFFRPLSYHMAVSQAQFWQAMTEHAAALAATVNLAEAYIPPFTPVITPKQTSSMTRKYAAQLNPWAADGRPALANNPWGAQPALDAPPTPSPYGAPAPSAFGASSGGTPVGAPLPQRPSRAVPPAAPGVQAQGQWDFNGADASELSFRAGDLLIIHEQTGDWWTAEMNGMRGQIPANYVKLL